MKKIIAIHVCLLLLTVCVHAGWQDIFEKYAHVMTAEEKNLFSQIHADFAAGKVPTIAAPEITDIPIVENNEELIDLKTTPLKRIEILPDPEAGKLYSSPTCNAGHPGASKMRKSVSHCFASMIYRLDELAPAFGYEPGQISIKIFEALRPLKLQEQLFNKKVKQLKEKYPKWTDEDAEKEAAIWISPVKNNVPAHSTGAAVDFALWNSKEENKVDMGILGTTWEHNPGPETFSDAQGVSDQQRSNRLFCLLAAVRTGLVNYPYEFWHFSRGDRYAAYWKKLDTAEYGAIE